MPLSAQKYFPYLILALFSIPLFFMGIHDVHSWGDDFSQYIKEAQNIAHGRPFYQSSYIYNSYNPEYAPPQYPPGYPLLLAPVVKFWGLSIRAMCYFNTVIAASLLFALFAYFRKYAGAVAAICLAILITYSGYMIDLKSQVLSDTVCLLFITLYLTFRKAENFTWQRITILTLLATMAILTRTQAILLVAAEALFLLFSFIKTSLKEKRFPLKQLYTGPSVYIVAGTLLFTAFLNKVVFYAPVSTDSFYNHFIDVTIHGHLFEIAADHLALLFTNLSGFFYYETYRNLLKADISFVQSMALVFVVIGFIISVSRRLSVDDIFFVLMCLLVLYLPVHDQRYFLPAIPLLFYYCYVTGKTILPAITRIDGRIIAIALTLLYFKIGFGYLKKSALEAPEGCIPQQKELVAFDYIRKHVSDSDILVFTKPRVIALYTNKRSINVAWQISPEMNRKIFDSIGVKYILVIDGFEDGYFHDYLNNIQHPIDSTRISEGYTLYTLR
jgi:dolichyl-phosphate-mannose-protein mannosyltransferase